MDKSETSGFEGERVAKVMARAGLCSRREAEEWIAAGRVAVNGSVIASPALNVRPQDKVAVDGKPLPARERTRLFLYHKPAGLVTSTADFEGRPTVFERLPASLPRLVSVGRLDLATEGLLLLTNDGGLARVLELPETGWLRRYRVRAHGNVTQQQLDALAGGIEIDGMRYGAIEASLDRIQGSNVWLTFAIREGKNREVRNVLGHLGLAVARLIRVSFGPFQLGELAEGAIEEVPTRTLREQIGERIARDAECDFAAPVIAREDVPSRKPEEPERPTKPDAPRKPPRGDKPRRRGERTLRREEKPRPPPSGDAPLRRKYRGGTRDAPAPDPERPRRAGLLTDRKGRRVLVERVTPEPKPEAEGRREEPRGRRHERKPHEGKRPFRPDQKHRPRRSSDRTRGPRPSRPRKR